MPLEILPVDPVIARSVTTNKGQMCISFNTVSSLTKNVLISLTEYTPFKIILAHSETESCPNYVEPWSYKQML